MNAEQQRLDDDRRHTKFHLKAWRKWGPYLSERQWGTVREDYSADGNAWASFDHTQSRGRAYRWGEDGLAGFSDRDQRLCLSVALWNGRDPFLKERLFGLTNGQGNHGEDVKELYYYLDATPTHSYLKYLYKYPQTEFPYQQLADESARRGRLDPEFELLDTGIFDDDRYFDVFVEYAKAGPDDVLMLVTAHNRGPDAADITIVPQVWFRNTWSWQEGMPRPNLTADGPSAVAVTYPNPAYYPFEKDHHGLDGFKVFADTDGQSPTVLFTDNDTNTPKLFDYTGQPGCYKDAFHEYLVDGNKAAIRTDGQGTKVGFAYRFQVPAGGSATVRVRLTNADPAEPFADFDALVTARKAEADEFYASQQTDILLAEHRMVQRQAWANLVWSRQYYYLDHPQWFAGDPGQPLPPRNRSQIRNAEWMHLNNADVVTMPDKWEYPYYCVWDSAFQAVALASIDPEWAKHELILFMREWYTHPNGQMPAYEWNFSDVNPPVHAWAVWRVFETDRARNLGGVGGDFAFLERAFHKLMLNFTWWVNRKDAEGRNVFQGGFLGMDNIGVFDRSSPLPTGGHLDQADGTAWMAMYCLNMMRIALELAWHNPVYEDVATKFFEHFLHIAEAMTDMGGEGIGLWDEQDRFYYDVLHLPDGNKETLRVRSMVGLVPLYAVEVLDPDVLHHVPEFTRRLNWFLNYRPDLAELVSHWDEPGRGERKLLSLLRGSRMKALLRRLLDETEFLSEHGPRSLSRVYRDAPYTFDSYGQRITVQYRPADSDSGMFGGNSNWRGPVWFPVSYLLIESLYKFHAYYSDDFLVECPTGSGTMLTIREVAEELSRRMANIWLADANGRRAVFGRFEKHQTDPHFRDYLWFSEYFDGDTGAGVGTAHQGWTCLVARLLQPRPAERQCPGGICPINIEAGVPESTYPTKPTATTTEANI